MDSSCENSENFPQIKISQNGLAEHEPFEISSVFGFSPKLGILCVKDENDRRLILYALANVACIIDDKTKTVQNVLSHEKNIEILEIDSSGRFLVTGDEDCIVLWDLLPPNAQNPVSLRMILKPFGEQIKIAKATISSTGRYVVITSQKTVEKDTEVQFWMWSFGNELCDGKGIIKSKFGSVRKICFSQNENEEEFFAITLDHTVAFGIWDLKKFELDIHIPGIKRFKQINASVYMPNTRYVASVTEQGQLLLWSDVLLETSPKPVTNRKNFTKAVPLPKSPVNDIRIIDGYLVTGDDNGEVRFYDTDIKLVFASSFPKLSPILFIQPVLSPRQYRLIEATNFDESTETHLEVIYKSMCPTDFSLNPKPFIVRNFYLTTKSGDIIYCDIVKGTTENILFQCRTEIVSCDYHPSKPWILTCDKMGRLIYYDYTSFSKMSQYVFSSNIHKDTTKHNFVSALQISPKADFVTAGFTDGLFFVLDSLALSPIIDNPISYTSAEIVKITISTSMGLCAYSDTNHTIVLLKYDPEWSFVGKYRYHCRPVVNIIFTEFADKLSMVTIGEDRLFIEYDLDESLANDHLVIKRDIRLEQSSVITAAELVPSSILERDTSTCGQVILTADNHYKFKVYDAHTAENLFTFLGPVFDSPLRRIFYQPPSDEFNESFLIFHSDKSLGMAVCPIDGNPFRYSGVIAHSVKINRLVLGGGDETLLVLGCGDYGTIMWNMSKDYGLNHLKSGGEGLLPFCSLLPGGKRGWIFNEIQDLFYYIQIMIKGVNDPEERVGTDFIPVTEIVDFMRGIGFFPSEFEAHNMKTEVARTTNPADIEPTEIAFDALVRLYINHKPIEGYSLEDIQKTMKRFSAKGNQQNELDGEDHFQEYKTMIETEKIFDLLTKMGERVSDENAYTYLSELLGDNHLKLTKRLTQSGVESESDNESNKFPEIISIEEFCRDLLGLEITVGSDGKLHSTSNDVSNLQKSVEPHSIQIQYEDIAQSDELQQNEKSSDEISE